jgi:alkanesulfonate monooxygenase SsuD/methylene tetrahydromethanopterin reductase-like flavin-dependent oxidoreductase (luciferase family)
MSMMELGVYTFADLGTHPDTLRRVSPAERLKNLIEEAVLAEQVGLDVFGIGEHHRPDFAVSAPAVVLGAVAARTSRIRLTTPVTVLGSADPVRVFQELATVDLLSGGRAEIMAGRGSFIESFPLFGVDMALYDAVFSEKLELLLALRASDRVAWTGRHRPPIDGLGVYPRPVQDPLPIWLAVGGTPASAVRAAQLGLPIALAIIGGQPERFRPFVDLYRESQRRAGRTAADLPLGINGRNSIIQLSISRQASAPAQRDNSNMLTIAG